MQKNSLSDLNQELLGLIEKEKILQEEYKKIKGLAFSDNYNDFQRPRVKLEVWNYDPALFAQKEVADIVSAYASLKEENDPRIDKAFEEIIRR